MIELLDDKKTESIRISKRQKLILYTIADDGFKYVLTDMLQERIQEIDKGIEVLKVKKCDVDMSGFVDSMERDKEKLKHFLLLLTK
jgi:hypothetical protein